MVGVGLQGEKSQMKQINGELGLPRETLAGGERGSRWRVGGGLGILTAGSCVLSATVKGL